ncbi:MAG: DNA-binding response regulator [Chloroflexi bacterium]|nr:MAG: DNA-binding response regulator [Chloroflexota bacterium]MBL1195309.1 DNA-binding response regulator [Chloroflexota bacterium]NOH12593.1 response regulator transcription factor [Chloroflexota bacterium]
MAGELILVVDDEPNIIQLAQMYLEREGFRVASVGDGEAALEAVEAKQPALMVLDVMLPRLDGFDVCRQLRADDNQILILMLTARDEDIDKIVGLELGADDYMTKPFNPRELVARVKAILRRADRPQQSTEPIHLGDMVIDPARREVTINGEAVELRTQEFDLLLTFAEHKGLVLSREQLLKLAWGYDFYGQTRTVDVHVAHLRKKIADSEGSIDTVTGVGYKLVV